MKDKIFVDSNIWLYLLQNDLPKKQMALQILQDSSNISVQVLNENANVCLRKFGMSAQDTKQHLEILESHCTIYSIDFQTSKKALEIHQKYQYSYYDSLIITSALENTCTILYSEDMQHGQMIESQVQIISPFI